MRLSILVLSLSLAVLTGCAQKIADTRGEPIPEIAPARSGEPLSPLAAYKRAFVAAKAWQRKAASVGGEWSEVNLLLEQAEAAAHGNDYELAKKLADKAREQGELGYEQMKSQKIVKNPPYLYN